MVCIGGPEACPGRIVLTYADDRKCELVGARGYGRHAAKTGSGPTWGRRIEAAPIYNQQIISCIKTASLWGSHNQFSRGVVNVGKRGYGVGGMVSRQCRNTGSSACYGDRCG